MGDVGQSFVEIFFCSKCVDSVERGVQFVLSECDRSGYQGNFKASLLPKLVGVRRTIA